MSSKRERYCFVTVGATASFDNLIRAVLTPSFLRALVKNEYTNLLIQFGKDGRDLFTSLATGIAKQGVTYGITVQGFPLTKQMRETMRITQGGPNGRREGVVICHAGTGSVLDAVRIGVPVVVVPNEDLLDNHQVEFAEQMAKMEYVVHGRIENLGQSLEDAEGLRQRIRSRPPPNAGTERQGSGLQDVLDEEMGIETAGRIE